MKYTCSKCGKAFDHADECKEHEKKCGKDKSFTVALVMRNEDNLRFYFTVASDVSTPNYDVVSEYYQDEDGHDVYLLACKCEDKKEIAKVKRTLIREMKKHLREAIKRLGIPEGIDYSELSDDED